MWAASWIVVIERSGGSARETAAGAGGGVRLGLMMAACLCIAAVAVGNVMTSAGMTRPTELLAPDQLFTTIARTTLTTWALLLGAGIASAIRQLRT